jgi:hypothetical protein
LWIMFGGHPNFVVRISKLVVSTQNEGDKFTKYVL